MNSSLTNTGTEHTALEVTVTAPVVSFRNPLYTGVQVTLPCPSPATVGGMLAAAAGGWGEVDPEMSFAMAFHARGRGQDLEVYHPLEASRKTGTPAPRNREFLADVTLRVWLFEELTLWCRRLRRPRWPLRLGRSQDLVGITLAEVPVRQVPGRQKSSLILDNTGTGQGRLRLTTATAVNRARNRWGSYRFDPTGRNETVVEGSWSAPGGQALVRLPSSHPDTVRRGSHEG